MALGPFALPWNPDMDDVEIPQIRTLITGTSVFNRLQSSSLSFNQSEANSLSFTVSNAATVEFCVLEQEEITFTQTNSITVKF